MFCWPNMNNISGYYYFNKEDQNSFTISENKWIKENLTTIIDFDILNEKIIKKQVNFSIKEYVIKVFLPTWIVFFLLICISCLLRSFTFDSILFVIVRMVSLVLLSCVLIFLLGLNKSEKNLLLSLFKRK